MSLLSHHLSAGHGQDTDVPVEVPAGELTQLQLQVLQPTVTEAEAQELKQVNCKLHFMQIMCRKKDFGRMSIVNFFP